MPDTTTPNLGLTKPEVGASADTWGNKWNDNADLLDASALYYGRTVTGASFPALRLEGPNVGLGLSNFDATLQVVGLSGGTPALSLVRDGTDAVKLALSAAGEISIGSGSWQSARLTLNSAGNLACVGTFVSGGTVHGQRVTSNSIPLGTANPAVEAYGAGVGNALSNFDAQLRVRAPSGNPMLAFYREDPSFIVKLGFDASNQFVLGGGSWNINRLVVNSVGNMAITGAASKPGGGMWADTSDQRIKTDIAEFHPGLELIRQLNPVRYRWRPETGRDATRVNIGLIAQQVEDVLPWAVTAEPNKIGEIEHEDMRTLDATSIVYLLINAVQTLADRVEELEAATGIGPSPAPSQADP